MFSFHTYYITVWFLHGQRAYTYKTQDKYITVNTVVLVPTGPSGEVKPAIVSGVHSEPPADFPADKIKPIVGRAGAKDQALFKDIDMRVPFDISSRAMKVNGVIVSVPTTHEERVKLRKLYGNDPRFKIIEQYPEPPQGTKIQKQDRKAKKTDDLDWIDRIEEFNAFMEDD
ncbi:MAG: hypothetical protein IK082_02415 [Oscillospiraceae bacterium]|nr:hypothetical protein [Oscillospiraceae bacterium]